LYQGDDYIDALTHEVGSELIELLWLAHLGEAITWLAWASARRRHDCYVDQSGDHQRND
jgi:hypothetical protein